MRLIAHCPLQLPADRSALIEKACQGPDLGESTMTPEIPLPPWDAQQAESMAETFREHMSEGGYIGHGIAKQVAHLLDTARREIEALRKERDDLSVFYENARSYGKDMLRQLQQREREIEALKAREMKAVEHGFIVARQDPTGTIGDAQAEWRALAQRSPQGPTA